MLSRKNNLLQEIVSRPAEFMSRNESRHDSAAHKLRMHGLKRVVLPPAFTAMASLEDRNSAVILHVHDVKEPKYISRLLDMSLRTLLSGRKWWLSMLESSHFEIDLPTFWSNYFSERVTSTITYIFRSFTSPSFSYSGVFQEYKTPEKDIRD